MDKHLVSLRLMSCTLLLRAHDQNSTYSPTKPKKMCSYMFENLRLVVYDFRLYQSRIKYSRLTYKKGCVLCFI